MNNYWDKIKEANKIVVKVGTSTLTHQNGKLNIRRIELLAKALSSLVNSGKKVVLVTSAAIGAGMGRLGLEKRPKLMREKQAVAAVGQLELMNIYGRLFSEYGQIVAQTLVTKEIIDDKVMLENAVNTFNTLLEWDIIPIVNENDTISTSEILFGDNDTLSAVVAAIIGADLLVILSDIDGLYDSDPHTNPFAKLIPLVKGITPELEAIAGGSVSGQGTGGMQTKIKAAQIALDKNVSVIIANGERPDDVLYKIFDGERVGTLFVKE